MITAQTINSSVTTAIPNGIYFGIWTSNLAKFQLNGETVELKTSSGIRGINCKCKITVTNENIQVEQSI